MAVDPRRNTLHRWDVVWLCTDEGSCRNTEQGGYVSGCWNGAYESLSHQSNGMESNSTVHGG